MGKLWAIGILQLWLLVMLYGWYTSRDGSTDRYNYDRFHKSVWTRWMLSSQTRTGFLNWQTRLHRGALPFAIGFYLLAMYGIWFF